MAKAKAKKSPLPKTLAMELEEFEKAALVLKALNHKVRQKILNLIHEKGEIKVSEIYAKLKIEQSLTSFHLGMLRKANVVKTTRQGQSIFYSVNYNHIAMVEKGCKVINRH